MAFSRLFKFRFSALKCFSFFTFQVLYWYNKSKSNNSIIKSCKNLTSSLIFVIWNQIEQFFFASSLVSIQYIRYCLFVFLHHSLLHKRALVDQQRDNNWVLRVFFSNSIRADGGIHLNLIQKWCFYLGFSLLITTVIVATHFSWRASFHLDDHLSCATLY